MDRYSVSNAQNGRLLVLLLNTLNGAIFPEISQEQWLEPERPAVKVRTMKVFKFRSHNRCRFGYCDAKPKPEVLWMVRNLIIRLRAASWNFANLRFGS